MKKALVFIDMDAVVRNFVHSGAFQALERRYDVTYVFHSDTTSEKKGVYTDPATLGLAQMETVEVPRKRMGMWWWLVTINALRLQRGKRNYEPRRNYVVNAIGEKRTRILDILALPFVFPFFRFAYTRYMGTHQPLDEFIARHQPDVIVHPSVLGGYFMNDLLQICQRRKIPFIALMNSWDNPSAKAMSSGYPDRLVVWGEHSKNLATEYMGIAGDRVRAIGAAQFQVYRRPTDTSERALRDEFGVPDGKRIVLYAGNGSGNYETVYLKMMDDMIESGEAPDVHVVYRPHPWRRGLGIEEQDFFAVPWKHISMDPSMADFYRQRIVDGKSSMYLADYNVMNRLLRLASAVVSPLSTVLLESVLNGKPAMMFYPLSNQSNDHNLGLVHFNDFIAKTSILKCDAQDDFPARFGELIAQIGDPCVADRLRDESRYFVADTGKEYGESLVDVIDDTVAEQAA